MLEEYVEEKVIFIIRTLLKITTIIHNYKFKKKINFFRLKIEKEK